MTRMMNSSSRSTFLQLFGFRRISHHGIAFLLLFLLSPAMEYVAAQPAREAPPRGPYNFNQRFSPSMAIIIVVLITAFFFMGFFSIYIRQCSDRRNGGSIRQAVTGRSRRAPRGLDPAVVETFPTFLYSDVKGLKIGKGVLECAVCLIEFEDDVTLRLLPKCDHVFHPECIDAWLGSHTTCPVCRANLVPQPGELPGATLHIPDSDGDSDHENQGSDSVEPQDQVSIRVPEDQSKNALEPDVINPTQILNQNRPPRSRSVRTRLAGKFPRSHSTGHSLVQPGENCERFTLRLPEDVRRQVVNGKLNRSTSCVAFPRQASSRRGYRSGGDGSSRGGKFFQLERVDQSTKSDRWVFSRVPPFFSRSGSARSPRKAVEGDATAGPAPRTLLTSVKTPFDCLGAKADEAEQSLSRPPV